jgi:hypothetical protein
MTKQQVKELLKEAFETGRQYQIHLYRDTPDSYFTKWYNSEVKGK